jgi:hypothetical protein
LWDQAAADYGGETAQAFADLSYRFALQGLSAEIASGQAAGSRRQLPDHNPWKIRLCE